MDNNKTQNTNALSSVIWIGLAVFLSYFCMYMFRKPYTASTFDQMSWMGVDYKIVLVIAQVLGYAISKFSGIKIISELKPERRLVLFGSLIFTAFLALVGFAFTPISWGPVWLFINGLPLGLIWGIVFTYCEGRKFTEVFTVFVSANFIITSGIAKSIGRWIIMQGYSEQMMPMIVGAMILPLLALSLYMLSKIPPQNVEEAESKSVRPAMTGADRINLLKRYALPIALFVVIYLVLTIVRDIRDNFAVEIWAGLGYSESPEIFTTTELPVTLFVLLSLAFLYKITNNKKALNLNLWICFAGAITLVLSTVLLHNDWISPVWWMMITGAGLFLPYILFNGIIFDRFIAAFKIVGNVGFIMYIADATGYLGSIFIMLYKNFGNVNLEWLPFYQNLLFYGALLIALLSIATLIVVNRNPVKN